MQLIGAKRYGGKKDTAWPARKDIYGEKKDTAWPARKDMAGRNNARRHRMAGEREDMAGKITGHHAP